jgi:hypothetical protein
VEAEKMARPKGKLKQKRKRAHPSAAMSVRELADELGVGINQAYEAIQRGDVYSFRFNKRIIIPRAAFQKKMEGSA